MKNVKSEDYWDAPDDDYAETRRAASYGGASAGRTARRRDGYGDDAYGDDHGGRGGGGFPLRGLAMILIGVAVLLALWAVYALMNGDDEDSDSAAASSETSVSASASAGAAASAQAGDTAAQATTAADDGAQARDTAAQAGEADQAQDAQAGTAAADATAAAGAADSGDAAQPAAAGTVERVNVLNNSTVQGLAESTAEELRQSGVTVGETGNLAESQAVLLQNTVYFDPNNAAAEQEARELADRYQGVAVAYTDSPLPEEYRNSTDVTLVLVQG